MSISWFITPYDPKHWEDPDDASEKPTSDLAIEPQDFYRYLEKHLPGIVPHVPYETTYELRSGDRTEVYVSLYHHYQIISLSNNPIPAFFDFILLYRAYVPATYRLFYFNSSSWESLELKPETTKRDIRYFMGYED
jgi:hypothetical protein